MVTNNIAALKPGEGNYNFFLNAQGRIQADCTAWMQEDSILLQTAADRIPALLALLDHFIIMDDVELTANDFVGNGIFLAGPDSAELLQATGFKHQVQEGLYMEDRQDADATLIRSPGSVIPQFEIWSGSPQDLLGLTTALRNKGATAATPEDIEHLRILSGTPLYGIDIRNSETAKDLPQETNQDKRALHFGKGCYLGQEIVERIRSRGAVHRTFTGFTLSGEVPLAGAPLTVDEKPVGELTSIARIGDRTLALGYIRREVLTKGASIQYPGGTAAPTELPFPLQL
jgi:aminomethyltransferase